MHIDEALQEPGTSVIDSYLNDRIQVVEYLCTVRQTIAGEVVTSEETSYEVYVDKERVVRFIYIDLGPSNKDLAIAWARGAQYGARKMTV